MSDQTKFTPKQKMNVWVGTQCEVLLKLMRQSSDEQMKKQLQSVMDGMRLVQNEWLDGKFDE